MPLPTSPSGRGLHDVGTVGQVRPDDHVLQGAEDRLQPVAVRPDRYLSREPIAWGGIGTCQKLLTPLFSSQKAGKVPRSASSAQSSSHTSWSDSTGCVPMTTTDHIPARTDPPCLPFAAASIHVETIAPPPSLPPTTRRDTAVLILRLVRISW